MKAPVRTAPAPAPTPFQLSRLYAQGWIAGSASGLGPGAGGALDAAAAALNPCTTEIERARWLKGFKESVARARR